MSKRRNVDQMDDRFLRSLQHRPDLEPDDEFVDDLRNQVKYGKTPRKRSFKLGVPLAILSVAILLLVLGLPEGLLKNPDPEVADAPKISDEAERSTQQDPDVQAKVGKLEQELAAYQTEKELFPVISNLSLEFVKAHTTGDKEKLRQLLSEDISLEEQGIELVAVIDGVEWNLFVGDGSRVFKDWVIQGYQYDREEETFMIHIREFYVDANGEEETPPTFLQLTFKQFGQEWKIVDLAFDV